MKKFRKFVIFTFLLMLFETGNAQETEVHFNQNISFGQFYSLSGSSGTICISNSGAVNPSPTINLVGGEPRPASVIVSTKSETPLDIKIEVRAEPMQSQNGDRLALSLNYPDKTFYTIIRGKPAEIVIGGCLEVTPETTYTSGDYKGRISVDVFILNK